MNKPAALVGYNDVKMILDEAAKHGGGRYALDTPGQAIHWRQRAYRFRKLYREVYPSDGRYEQFNFQLDGPEVIINPNRPTGTFIPAGGEPLPMNQPAAPILPEEDDELFDAAKNLRKDLGLD